LKLYRLATTVLGRSQQSLLLFVDMPLPIGVIGVVRGL
jgi:hypothetical protein